MLGGGGLWAIATEVRHKTCMIRAASGHARDHLSGDCQTVDPLELQMCAGPSQIRRNYPLYKKMIFISIWTCCWGSLFHFEPANMWLKIKKNRALSEVRCRQYKKILRNGKKGQSYPLMDSYRLAGVGTSSPPGPDWSQVLCPTRQTTLSPKEMGPQVSTW